MYNAFFEFEENPFSPTPDPAFFYRSKQHDTALRSLTFTVQSRMGLSSITGEEGTGKTMLLECLRETLESTQIQCAFLRDSRISSSRFFQAIASELDLKCQGTSAYQVFSALHQFTLQQARKGRTVALIVDDAHNLSADVLNEILHLASLHDDKVKLLQTVLSGRPQLLPTLDALNLERLKQHAVLSCHLDPFTAQETQDYIEFRLAQAGLPEQTIFPPDALAEIHLRSRGFAPAIHAICEGLLLAAFSAGSKVCTPAILDQVFNRTQHEEPEIVEAMDLRLLSVSSEPEPPEPEPPALLTALLRLTFAAIKTLPPPLPVNTSDALELLQSAARQMSPARMFALPVGDFPVGSKTPMLLTAGA
jgi:general secretion pathway protein A